MGSERQRDTRTGAGSIADGEPGSGPATDERGGTQPEIGEWSILGLEVVLGR